MRYDNIGGVKEFMQKMVHIQTKLKAHDKDLNEKKICPICPKFPICRIYSYQNFL